jgi:hypothetical protein
VRRTTLFWILAFLITAGIAIYQRLTGPTYPLAGGVRLDTVSVGYRLDRSHGGDGDHEVSLATGTPAITGRLEWKRHKTEDRWSALPMAFSDGSLRGSLPHQPPAGKLDYRIFLQQGNTRVVVPETGGVVIRFKGDVPLFILIPHVIVMFGAMLLSTRAGLEIFGSPPRYTSLTGWTIGFLAVGGMILGPIVQKYAFDAYWTGWPFGHDLTDNKTLIALVAWIVAAVAIPRVRNPRPWVLGAALVVLIVFLIPHSVLGSELDYQSLDMQQNPAGGPPPSGTGAPESGTRGGGI